MPYRWAIAVALLASMLAPAQSRSPQQRIKAINRAKKTLVSSLDGLLPNLTLEDFVLYETGDPNTEWGIRQCEDRTKDVICVESESALRDQRLVRVTVAVPNTVSLTVKLVSAKVIENGADRVVRLSALPVIIHSRQRPRVIRDLPSQIGTVS